MRTSKVMARRGIVIGSLAIVTMAAVGIPSPARAQWSRTYEQFYLPGNFNWTFRRQYAAADRLFNAFDYGHSILYERLYTEPGAAVGTLETDEYNFITQKLLVSPPDLPLEETAIEVNYAKMAPEAKMMFDWAHLLHRQVYDVLASENMTQAEKDAKIAELIAYYKTRPDLAFSSAPKNMTLMEGQPYSLAFRRRYPKFNGLIWGYHWLQVGLYEPLMTGRSREERQAGVTAAVARFRQMLDSTPDHMPRIMPMTAAVAPTFAARYPEAAIIFDNLHAMHDVVSDILTNNQKVPRDGKRATILEAASRYRDATSFIMSIAEWKSMGEMMGLNNMGGPAVGILAAWPTPTLARGSSMREAMNEMQHSSTGAMAGMPGMSHDGESAATKAGMAAMPAMSHPATDSMSATMPQMMEMHERMMNDPVIRERVMADTALRRMMEKVESTHGGMPHDIKGMEMSGKPTPLPKRQSATMPKKAVSSRPKTNAKKKTPTKTSEPTKPAPAKATPADHSKMPGMKMPAVKP